MSLMYSGVARFVQSVTAQVEQKYYKFEAKANVRLGPAL